MEMNCFSANGLEFKGSHTGKKHRIQASDYMCICNDHRPNLNNKIIRILKEKQLICYFYNYILVIYDNKLKGRQKAWKCEFFRMFCSFL